MFVPSSPTPAPSVRSQEAGIPSRPSEQEPLGTTSFQRTLAQARESASATPSPRPRAVAPDKEPDSAVEEAPASSEEEPVAAVNRASSDRASREAEAAQPEAPEADTSDTPTSQPEPDPNTRTAHDQQATIMPEVAYALAFVIPGPNQAQNVVPTTILPEQSGVQSVQNTASPQASNANPLVVAPSSESSAAPLPENPVLLAPATQSAIAVTEQATPGLPLSEERPSGERLMAPPTPLAVVSNDVSNLVSAEMNVTAPDPNIGPASVATPAPVLPAINPLPTNLTGNPMGNPTGPEATDVTPTLPSVSQPFPQQVGDSGLVEAISSDVTMIATGSSLEQPAPVAVAREGELSVNPSASKTSEAVTSAILQPVRPPETGSAVVAPIRGDLERLLALDATLNPVAVVQTPDAATSKSVTPTEAAVVTVQKPTLAATAVGGKPGVDAASILPAGLASQAAFIHTEAVSAQPQTTDGDASASNSGGNPGPETAQTVAKPESSDATAHPLEAPKVAGPQETTATHKAQLPTGRADSNERIQILQQVTRHLEAVRLTPGRGELTFQLNPEHLGTVRVTVSQTGEGVVARLVTESVQAQSALDGAKEHLRTALEQKGLTLRDVEVSLNTTPQGSGHFGQGHFGDGLPRSLRPYYTARSGSENILENSPTEAVVNSRTVETSSQSRLDYRA